MADFVAVPLERLPEGTLQHLLEEFCSRDGTDYGASETPLAARVEQLHARLRAGDARLLFDAASEQWDIVAADAARTLLAVE